MRHPIGRARHEPRGEQPAVFRGTAQPAIQVAPPPLLRPANQVRALGLAFGITGHPQQVIVVLKGKRLEASLIHVAGAGRMAIGVPSLGVRQGQPADKLRQFSILPPPHDQMSVMAHHTARQQPRLRSGDRFDEDVFESLVIGVFLENRQAGVRAVQDVINVTAFGCSLRSSPAARLPIGPRLVIGWCLAPFVS